MSEFRPVLYLKASCPFCLKVAAFVCEAGLLDSCELRDFWPDDEREQAIRTELAPHLETVTFPAMQYAPGAYMSESDAIIQRFAEQSGIDPDTLPFFQYVVSGPMRRMREQFIEIRRLSQEAAAIS